MSALVRPSALRVILPALPGADAASVAPLAADLAANGGAIVLLAVVPVPRGHDLAGPTAAARAARRQLRSLAALLPQGATPQIAVRAAETLLEGVQQVAGDGDLLIIPLPAEPAAATGILAEEPYRGLVAAPVCDTVFIRPGTRGDVRSVLVSARGGPHAELALEVAQRISRKRGATVTVMHVDVPGGAAAERQQEQRLFQSLVAHSADAPRLRTSSVPASSAEEAVLAEGERHDLVVLGARIGTSRRESDLGPLPRAVLEHSSAGVVVVKSRRPVNPAIFRPRRFAVEELVNTWFVENTRHCREYANLEELVAEKRRRGLSVGVALLAGESLDTLAAHARVLEDDLTTAAPLLDEAVLFAGPDERFLAAADAVGLRAVAVPEAGPGQRGRLMHASLACLRSDIVVWIDADIRNPHAKLVYGLAGPLINDERLQYVKGFFGRPSGTPDADLESLVGELAARPLLNLFFAELSGLIDPLGVEQAIRRRSARSLPLFSGSAAQLALLIDVFDRFGLPAICQVALEERIARPLEMSEASRRAFSAVQVLTSRLGISSEEVVSERATPTIKLIHHTGDHFQVTAIDARETELLP